MSLSRLQLEVARSLGTLGEGSAPSTLVAGLSGGADSVALLHALLRAATGVRVVAAHLDHGLRPDSARDAAFCRRLCRTLGVPLRVGRADVRARAARDGGGIEEAARRERHAFLEAVRVREDAEWIVLAHTRDDQAETVLLRLLRGSGSLGLGAMRARAGRVLRPLLSVTRQNVLDHLAAHGLAWREDPSNADPTFLRNRVRHELIPYLESRFNPALRESLARTAGVLGEEAEVLAALASTIALRATDGATSLPREAVARAPRAVARIAVRNAVRAAGGLRNVALHQIDAIIDLAARPAASGRRVALPGSRNASIHFDEIRFAADGPSLPSFDAALAVPGRAPLPDGRWIVAHSVKRPSPRAVAVPAGPLTLRTRRAGDRVRSAGREMSLKRFLMDRRVPAADRDRVPVVACGGTVVWVFGQDVEGAAEAQRHVRLVVTAPRRGKAAHILLPGRQRSGEADHRMIEMHIGGAAVTMKGGRRPGVLMGRKPGRAAK